MESDLQYCALQRVAVIHGDCESYLAGSIHRNVEARGLLCSFGVVMDDKLYVTFFGSDLDLK
jgi:hypothetical protein